MKARTLAALLALVLVLGVFAGCSGRAGDEEESEPVEEESSSLPETPEEPSSSEEESEDENESKDEDASEADVQTTSEASQEQQAPASKATIYAAYAFDNLTGYGMNAEWKVGTQEQLDAAKAYFQELSADGITTLSAEVSPSSYTKDYALSSEELNELVGMLKAFEPTLLPEEELGNPYTGGGWTIYIDSPQGQIICSYSGWFTVTYPGGGPQIFRADEDAQPFQAVNDYIWRKMDSIH